MRPGWQVKTVKIRNQPSMPICRNGRTSCSNRRKLNSAEVTGRGGMSTASLTQSYHLKNKSQTESDSVPVIRRVEYLRTLLPTSEHSPCSSRVPCRNVCWLAGSFFFGAWLDNQKLLSAWSLTAVGFANSTTCSVRSPDIYLLGIDLNAVRRFAMC